MLSLIVLEEMKGRVRSRVEIGCMPALLFGSERLVLD